MLHYSAYPALCLHPSPLTVHASAAFLSSLRGACCTNEADCLKLSGLTLASAAQLPRCPRCTSLLAR